MNGRQDRAITQFNFLLHAQKTCQSLSIINLEWSVAATVLAVRIRTGYDDEIVKTEAIVYSLYLFLTSSLSSVKLFLLS